MSQLRNKKKSLDRIVTHSAKRDRFSRYFSRCYRDYFTPEFKKLLEDPDASIKPPHLKTDATTTVTLVELNGKQFVIKRYNIKRFWHGLKRAIQPTRAARCWRSAHQLLRYGIATPKPIAMIERRVGPLRREGYYIYEYIPGQQGFDVFRDTPASETVTIARAQKTAEIIKKLLDSKISHGDMKASNFIYADTQPYLIDLDAMRHHRFNFIAKKRREREVERFLMNWADPKTKLLFETLLRR